MKQFVKRLAALALGFQHLRHGAAAGGEAGPELRRGALHQIGAACPFQHGNVEILALPETEVLISGADVSYLCPKTPDLEDIEAATAQRKCCSHLGNRAALAASMPLGQ